ncbi:hypothetical protein [Halocatena halophila]|uniref:hypothetical protein n=1 Tax=Halocatena halophila TaxID=2814576 RepID=UPI002ED5494B
MGLFGSDKEEKEARKRRGGFKVKDEFPTRSAVRVIDEEAEVVIYANVSHNYSMMSAVPIKDTALELPDDDNAEE